MQDSENVIVENPREPHRLQLSGQSGPFQSRTSGNFFKCIWLRINGDEVSSIIYPSLCRDSGIVNVMQMPARWKLELFATNTSSPLASANVGRDLEREWRDTWLNSDTTRSKLDSLPLFLCFSSYWILFWLGLCQKAVLNPWPFLWVSWNHLLLSSFGIYSFIFTR